MIHQLKNYNWWIGFCVSRQAMSLTHLMYVDNTLLFLSCNEKWKSYCQGITQSIFANLGQHINYQKSTIVCSPSVSHHMKAEIVGFTSHKISFSSWKISGHVYWWSKIKSQAGRLVLIKNSFPSLLVYPFSCMNFSSQLCHTIAMKIFQTKLIFSGGNSCVCLESMVVYNYTNPSVRILQSYSVS